MIRIAIVDDQKEILSYLDSMIRELLPGRAKDYEVCAFQSGEELISQKDYFDIIFLDIEMSGIDGIETGEYVFKRNPDCIIIMATAAIERYKEDFRIRAFRFVTKPFVRSEIEEALTAACKLVNTDESIDLFYQRILYKIKFKQIQYIQSYNGYCEFLVNNKIFRKEITLQEVEDTFPKEFFVRIHRQYVINMRWISSYDKGVVTIGKEKIGVSARKLKDFEARYIAYDVKYRRNEE